MTEYKENTVGWWLSQLKEPLKSRALGIVMDTSHPCDNLDGALTSVLNCLIEGSIMWTYWQGVYVYYFGGLHIDSTNFKDGFDIAHECDPWREDKAIVDSPEKTRELFFYGGKINNPFNEPLTISPSGEMLSVIVEEDKIKELMNANPGVTFWPTNVGGVSPEKPKNWIDQELWKWHTDMVKGGVEYADAERGKVKLVTDSPAREIEAPERAVVGYEEPKPIDTIEKKHEIRIQNLEAYNKYKAERDQQIMDLNPHVDFYDSEGNLIRPSHMTALEARVKELEGVVGKLEQQIEYVYRNLPKDFDGTR